MEKIYRKILTNRDTIFYGIFLAELNKKVVKDHPYCKTACVSRQKDDINVSLLFNEDFINTLNDDEKIYLTLHELLHVCFEHIFGVFDYLPKKKLINIAEDLEINSILGWKNMPKGGQHPFSYNFKGELGTLEYYKLLDNADEEKKSKGTSGNSNLDELLDKLDEIDLGHDLWKEIENLSDSQKQILKREITYKLQRSAEECKSMGNIPKRLQEKLTQLFNVQPPVIDWKKAFRNFVDGSIKSTTFRTYRKENYRFEESMGNKVKYLPRILMAIDQSGSMSDYDLEEIYSQLFHIYRTGIDVDILPWDGELGTLQTYRGTPIIERELGGGTDPNVVLKWLQKNYHKYSCAIIGTDGYVPHIKINSPVSLLWVITSNGSTNFNTKERKIKIQKQK